MRVFNFNGAEIGVSNNSFVRYVMQERHKMALDVIVLGYNAFEQVDLQAEIDEKTNHFKRIVNLSHDESAFVLCGVKTKLNDSNYIGACAAANGKFLGTCDRTGKFDDIYTTSDRIKVFNTKFGMWGVLIDKDGNDETLWEKTIPLSDLIVNITTSENVDEVAKLAKKYLKPCLVVTEQDAHLFDYSLVN